MESKRKSEDTLQLLYTLDKGGMSTELRGKKVSSVWCWKSWTDAYKSRKSEQSLTPYIKLNKHHSLLQEIVQTQRLNLGLLHCRFFTI